MSVRNKILVLLLLSLYSCADKDSKVLDKWKDGYMDIHFINTGRGESILHIFPDGTTMLADAAGSLLKEHRHMPVDPKPSAEISSGKVISDYAEHFLPEKNGKKLDYYMITHFHSDHMGDYSDSLPLHSSGLFRLTSFAEVGARLPFDVVLFRKIDDMRPSTVIGADTAAIENMKSFLAWAEKEYGAEVETFEAGMANQIQLKHNPLKYPDFEIRNIASGGYVWTGKDEECMTLIPDKETMMKEGGKNALPPENILSCAFRVSYGDFDYFSGGDIQYAKRSDYPYFDIEEPVSKVVGKVEAMKASHHCTANANSRELLEAARPDVVVANVWRDVQPNPATLKRIIDANRDCQIFLTNLAPKNAPEIQDCAGNIMSTQGHIVIRIFPGGKKYMIYVLDDSNQTYEILKTFGPYNCL